MRTTGMGNYGLNHAASARAVGIAGKRISQVLVRWVGGYGGGISGRGICLILRKDDASAWDDATAIVTIVFVIIRVLYCGRLFSVGASGVD